MNEWAPAVGTIGLALIIGATLVLRGRVGKALAQRRDADRLAPPAR